MNAENLEMWVHPDFLFLVAPLIILGLVLKHRTKLTNGMIPLTLYLVAIVFASVWGYFISQYEGGQLWYDAIVRSGLCQGMVITAIAVLAYSVKHDTGKVIKVFKEAIKKEKADE